MLKGCDISAYQRNNYQTIINNNNAFCIIKATEGVSYKNPYMDVMADYAQKHGKLIGFYHYARPENNTAEAEATEFAEAVKKYIGRAVLVLDYEGTAHRYGAKWAADFVKAVKKKTGVLPIFYTSASYLPLYSRVASTGAGVWVAAYGRKKRPAVWPWKVCALWQYSASGYDHDYFYGDAKAWAAYAKVKK